ncbi:hypothetical protein NECAME_13438 [Necator americanus]|uniref:Uncharacterized protein n=1 Tax=Necator americanus TaxID=51031 RepID=W2SY31_NECAM|nr:hypothetical protein NECAME_13438 [Necator americanus]ETN73766.1 hypothetical protein NECAME_13438 [Necator americanus]
MLSGRMLSGAAAGEAADQPLDGPTGISHAGDRGKIPTHRGKSQMQSERRRFYRVVSMEFADKEEALKPREAGENSPGHREGTIKMWY